MPRQENRRVGRWSAMLALVALLAAAGPAGRWARGDEAEESLDRYRQKVDAAIDRGLAYLAKHQEKDGAFAFAADIRGA